METISKWKVQKKKKGKKKRAPIVDIITGVYRITSYPKFNSLESFLDERLFFFSSFLFAFLYCARKFVSNFH